MMRRYCNIKWILALLAMLPVCTWAQVQVQLVAVQRSIQPGGTLDVALRMQHEPHWHSYWLNAGTGYPTRVEWQLPAGWQAGDIQWPTPILIKDSKGQVTGHGYDGLLYLPIQLTAPPQLQTQTAVEIKGTAHWLMCADICIPGSQEVSVSIPIQSAVPALDTELQAALAAQSMPQAAMGWTFVASQLAQNVNVTVQTPAGVTPQHFFSEHEFIQYDKPQKISSSERGYTLELPIADAAQVPAELKGLLAYQDKAGVYKSVQVAAPLVAGAAADGGAVAVTATPPSLSFGLLLLALLGGLILNLMPCVFPVLGIKVLGFMQQAGQDQRKVTFHSLTFTTGVLLSFWVLVAVLAVLRASGAQLGWGFQLQSAAFVFAIAAIMLIFAMNLSGVFEFGLRATAVGGELQTRQGYAGSFFAGVLATVVATPCSAPFLAPALGAALTLPVLQSFIVFTVVAIGLSLPYLLLSIFPRLINLLPRPGRWMETFKQAMAFPLYATVAFLIWVLAGQVGEEALLSALFGLTVIALAIWLYGRFGAIPGLLILILGLYLGWPRAVAVTTPQWEPWSAARVTQLRAEGRSIYVDFTARWCATCQANKKLVFGSEEVREYIRGHNIALLKADWTNHDAVITAELARFGRSAVPFNIIYRQGTTEPLILPEVLTPQIVLRAFGAPP
jgi:thiol:disulfide interchange protein